MSRSATLGAVVVSYNTRELLAACLNSLRDEIERLGLDAEVWVVDNDSADGSAEMVARDFPTLRLRAEDCNHGFTTANNLILEPWSRAEAGCPDRVLLLNPDAALEPGALAAMLEVLAGAPDVAVVGPSLYYPDGRFQHAAFRFPGLLQTALDLFPIGRLQDRSINGRYPRARYAEGAPFEVDFVLGACMLIRGRALRQLGALDEGYFMYCEEIDWCRRAAEAGWRRLCVPAARVQHHAGASTGQPAFRSAAFINLWRSRRRYFAIHAPAWRRLLIEGLIRLGLAWRALGDWWAARRGRIDAGDLADRVTAYRVVLRPLEPELRGWRRGRVRER